MLELVGLDLGVVKELRRHLHGDRGHLVMQRETLIGNLLRKTRVIRHILALNIPHYGYMLLILDRLVEGGLVLMHILGGLGIGVLSWLLRGVLLQIRGVHYVVISKFII